MSFHLIVQLPGNSKLRGHSDCSLACDAFPLYRRLARTSVRVVEIFDLRGGERRPITGAELEAIAQQERHQRHRAACRNACRDAGGRVSQAQHG